MRSFLSVLLCVAVSTMLSPLSAAQSDAAQDGLPIADLKTALDLTAWNSAENGPILAIGPEKIFHGQQYTADGDIDDSSTLYTPRPGHGLRVETVARYFDCRDVHFPSLTVVARREMVVLNTHLKEPDIYEGLQNLEKLEVLEATLSPSQWQLLGSSDGIGLGDLTQRQQPVFLSLLPEATSIVRQKFVIDDHGGKRVDPAGTSQLDLSDDARQQIRLRLDRTSSITLLRATGRGIAGMVNTGETALERTYFQGGDQNSAAKEDIVFGQPVRLRVPNQPKPSQIDFAMPKLNASIHIAGARTAGDLVALVRKMSGVAIYVDGRLAVLPLYLKGAERDVRAGDVLQALCLALSGAIRKVGGTQSVDTTAK